MDSHYFTAQCYCKSPQQSCERSGLLLLLSLTPLQGHNLAHFLQSVVAAQEYGFSTCGPNGRRGHMGDLRHRGGDLVRFASQICWKTKKDAGQWTCPC